MVSRFEPLIPEGFQAMSAVHVHGLSPIRLLSVFIFLAYSAAAVGAELRTWSDSTGKHKIKASFVSLADGTVTLEKADGSTLEIELKQLSKADQTYVADEVKSSDDNPFKTKPASPFKAKPKSKPPVTRRSSNNVGAGSDDSSASSGAPRTLKVDYSNVELVALGNTEKWELAVPEAGEAFDSKPKTSPLPPKTSFFESIKGIAVNPVAGKAAVSFVFDQPKPLGTTRVVLCDLATGKTTPPASAAAQMVCLAVHDDGQQIVMRRDEFGFGNQDRLEVWSLKGPRVERVVSWIPYDDAQHGGRDVTWGEFLDSTRLATSSRGGKVVIWSFPDLEPLTSFSLADGAVPALSPDRKQIAYANGKEIGVFDVARGEVVAQQSTSEPLTFPQMAFSPSGKKLAAVAGDKLLIWDTATGNAQRNIALTGIIITEGIQFPDDDFVLVNGHVLIDLENQLKLWSYEGQQKTVCSGGWTFIGVSEGEKKSGALIAAKIPHPAARSMLKKALTQPDLFVVHPGTTVKLNVNGISDAAQRERVRQALADRLKTIECAAGDNGTIELVASMEGPKQRQIRYMFGGGDYNVQEYTARLKFVYQGQTAWETTGTNVPGVLSLKKGENVGDKLRTFEKPDYGFFDRALLPKFLQKPTASQGAGRSLTLGQSKVTTSGVTQ
jgi:WD40 repeat protein